MCIRDRGKGAVKYKKGEKIAIKINLNDNGGTNIIDATPVSYTHLKSENVRLTLNQKARELDKQKQDFQTKYQNNAYLSPERCV